MKKIVYLLIMVITSFSLNSCNSKSTIITESENTFKLHETPQEYILQDEDTFTIMPTVTLYENGNAKLSQPIISSYALFSMGSYTVVGNELTIIHDENIHATFKISDHGDTLTLRTTTLGFTKVGSVYRFRPNLDNLSQYDKVDGEILTIDILRELVKKAPNLTLSNFEKYAHYKVNEARNIYDVNGKYTLETYITSDGDNNLFLNRNSDGERFPLNFNGSTNYVFDVYLGLAGNSTYEAQLWFDYFKAEALPEDETKQLTLPEFPGVAFTCTPGSFTVGDKLVFQGMPIWNMFLTDLTNDGKPEFCATISLGSGIVDHRILVYDYVTDRLYELEDRFYYDYNLSMEGDQIIVTQTNYNDIKPVASATLQLIKGEIYRFGLPR
jgi:hypothetical protein